MQGGHKAALKRAGAATWGALGASRSQSRVVCLCYHSVHPELSFASVSPPLFERHLAWLTETSDVIPLRDALDAARARELRRPTVAITFDDGYEDNHRHALPLLRKYGVPATVFVTAGLAERDPEVTRRFETLRGVAPGGIDAMDWTQLREMLDAGIEIGAHTYSHPNLIRLTRAEAELEVRRSKAVLESRLDAEVDLMAYPFGKPGRHFSDETAALAREAGYRCAAAVLFRAVKPRDSPFALPRFFVTRDTVDELREKVRGDWDYLGLVQERAPRGLAKVLSPQDFRF
jgi:peptidoglycan/xylan/chitin deacetylase (PgdA/CDA1 family)